MLKRSTAIVATIALLLTGVAANATPKPKPKLYTPSQTIADRCGYDSTLKGQAAAAQIYLNSVGNCMGAGKIVPSKMSNLKPKTAISKDGQYADIAKCKLPQPSGAMEFRGFPAGNTDYYSKKHHPAAGSLIQVIGVSAKDAPPGKNLPSQDYKLYIDSLKAWFGNVNNSASPVTVRVADKWYDLGEQIAPYKLTHHPDPPRRDEIAQKIISAVDGEIDFSGVGYVLVVFPAGTPFAVVEQAGLGGAKSAEGQIFNMSVAQPANFKVGQRSAWSGFLTINMFIHELYHPGFNMGDQVGDGNWVYENRGMGQWGMFAAGNTDMLHWQKWLLGFTTDNQVKCAPLDATTTTWLAPGSTKTNKPKMIVVPFSSTEALVVESVRATGMNYKLASEEQGALVYRLDLTDLRYDFGYEVQYPDQRKWSWSRYAMGTAPLRKGESFTYKGVKVTNVEWGDFGDVIKVEPVK
jgi:M6 family metalloprotease-like protein